MNVINYLICISFVLTTIFLVGLIVVKMTILIKNEVKGKR